MRAAMFGQIGEYKMIERIGRGGMGEVWLANKIGFAGIRSVVVVKLLHAQHASDHKAREYFINEARLAAQLDHPNIVKVIHAGEADGQLYLVMERVDGVNLATLLRHMRDAGLPLPLALRITCYIVGEVLTGLVYAHELRIANRDAGIVHFDVTPNNILISSSGNVKLTDFGLSRVAVHAQNVSFVAGTPRYMSIEHHTATPRRASDIYGVGVVTHELVSGRLYHHGLEPRQIRDAILHGVVHPLGRDDVEAWLVQLIMQMLAADYTQRPSARVALEIILRNVLGYRQAALELAEIYRLVVGPARSGQTQLLQAVPEHQQSFIGTPSEPRALIPASAGTVGPTISTPPPMAAVSPDLATVIESPSTPPAIEPPQPIEPPVAAVEPQPAEELVEPTEVLPGFSHSHLPDPAHAARPQVRVDSNSGNVVIAGPVDAVPEPTTMAARRILLGVGIGVGFIAFLGLGWVIGTLMNDDEEPKPEVAEKDEEAPQPAAVAKSEQQPATSNGLQPSRSSVPDVDNPKEIEDPPVVTEPKGDNGEVVNGTETTPPTPPTNTTKKDKDKPKPPDPIRVLLYIKGQTKGTVKINSKEHKLVDGMADIKLAPGSYSAKWRTSDTDSWHDAGKIVVSNIAPKFYEFRLAEGTAERKERGGK